MGLIKYAAKTVAQLPPVDKQILGVTNLKSGDMATWLFSRWRKYKGRYIDAKGVSREGLWKAAACDVSTWGPSRSQHIDTHYFLLDVSYCAASAIGHVYACNTLRSSL